MSLNPPFENSPLEAPALVAASAILIVDEDPAFQLGLKTFLREYVGYDRVFTARSGAEALEFLRADPSIEVVTLDRQVPGMDGFELVEAIKRQADHPLALVMISGSGEEGLEERFRCSGDANAIAWRLLPKPVDFERLEPVVLAAQEEVLKAKRRAAAAAVSGGAGGGASGAAAASLEELAVRIGEQSLRVAELEREIRAQRGKWRADFWKVAFVLLLFWLAGQFGVAERLEPQRERAVELIKGAIGWKGDGNAGQEEASADASEPAAPDGGRQGGGDPAGIP